MLNRTGVMRGFKKLKQNIKAHDQNVPAMSIDLLQFVECRIYRVRRLLYQEDARVPLAQRNPAGVGSHL